MSNNESSFTEWRKRLVKALGSIGDHAQSVYSNIANRRPGGAEVDGSEFL